MVVVSFDEVSDLPGRMVSFCQNELCHGMGDSLQNLLLPVDCSTENATLNRVAPF